MKRALITAITGQVVGIMLAADLNDARRDAEASMGAAAAGRKSG